MATKELVTPTIKLIEVGSVADGATAEDSWTADDDYVIRHILIKADGEATTKSTITMRIDDYVITKDRALCNTFGTDARTALLLNIPLKKSATFHYSIHNAEGAAKDFTIELVLEPAS